MVDSQINDLVKLVEARTIVEQEIKGAKIRQKLLSVVDDELRRYIVSDQEVDTEDGGENENTSENVPRVEIKKKTCDDCGESFDPRGFAPHLRSHASEKKEDLIKSDLTISDLDSPEDDPNKVICPYCSKPCAGVNKHISIVHGSEYKLERKREKVTTLSDLDERRDMVSEQFKLFRERNPDGSIRDFVEEKFNGKYTYNQIYTDLSRRNLVHYKPEKSHSKTKKTHPDLIEEYLEENPGQMPTAIAEGINLTSDQVGNAIFRMKNQDRIKQVNGLYYPVDCDISEVEKSNGIREKPKSRKLKKTNGKIRRQDIKFKIVRKKDLNDHILESLQTNGPASFEWLLDNIKKSSNRSGVFRRDLRNTLNYMIKAGFVQEVEDEKYELTSVDEFETEYDQLAQSEKILFDIYIKEGVPA